MRVWRGIHLNTHLDLDPSPVVLASIPMLSAPKDFEELERAISML